MSVHLEVCGKQYSVLITEYLKSRNGNKWWGLWLCKEGLRSHKIRSIDYMVCRLAKAVKDLGLTNAITQPVKLSMFLLRLRFCWLLSEDLSPPSSAVLQVLQMMVFHGGRKTCRVDRVDHKVEKDTTLSAPSLAQVNVVVLYAN